MVAVKNPRNLTQVQFYQVCEWLKKQSQPVGLTRGQLCRAASDELKYEISESAMAKAAKTTGVKVIDPRAHNFAGSDRSVRLAKAIFVLCEELKKQIGFAVPVMGLKIEAGKRYVTRAGCITPPIEEDLEAEENGNMRFYAGDDSWCVEGTVFHSGEDRDDLVAEFVEVAPLPDVTDDLEHQTLEMMRKLGGEFVQHLASAYLRADKSNQQKIRNTFREYWSTYYDMVYYGTNGGAN